MLENSLKKILIGPVKLVIQKAVDSIESEDSRWFKWITEHTAFILLLSTFIGALITFITNFAIYIYYLAYAIYWQIDMTNIVVNHGNILYSFLVSVILGVALVYPFYFWAKSMYVSRKCSYCTFAIILAPLMILFILSWVNKFYKFEQLTIYYISTIIAIWIIASLFISAFLFMGFLFYITTKDFELKRQGRKDGKEIRRSKISKQKRIAVLSKKANKIVEMFSATIQALNKILSNPLLFIPYLVAYIVIASVLTTTVNRNFDILQVGSSDTYAVLSRKDNDLYLVKCVIVEDVNKNSKKTYSIMLYPNIHKLTPSDNLILQSRTFSDVDKKYEFEIPEDTKKTQK